MPSFTGGLIGDVADDFFSTGAAGGGISELAPISVLDNEFLPV